jgi:hypothetical protein
VDGAAVIIRIRPLLDLRHQHGDQTLLDYLTLVTLAPTPGALPVATLREHWSCSQPMVSRRMAAVARTGLADITPGWGGYQVHAVHALTDFSPCTTPSLTAASSPTSKAPA